MKNELYLYDRIYPSSAQTLISEINSLMGQPIDLRVYSPGGDVEAGYGICAKIAEHGDITLKVDGSADSMAAFMLIYAKRVECLDVSTFIMHRASYPSWVDVTDAMQASLDKMNKDLKSKMLKKINPMVFQTVTGFTLDQMFGAKERIDIELNATQARQIGLVNKVNILSPSEATALQPKLSAAALAFGKVPVTAEAEKNPMTQKQQAEAFLEVLKNEFRNSPIGRQIQMDKFGAELRAYMERKPGIQSHVITAAEAPETPAARAVREKEISDFTRGLKAELGKYEVNV